MKRLILPLLFGLLPVVVIFACVPSASPASSQTGNSAGPPQQLTLQSLDSMEFEPSTLSAKAGQPIQLALDNSAAKLQHDFDIDATDGLAQSVKLTAQPGQTATVTFTIGKPGTYAFYCGQPGHETAGMKGTLTVQ